MKNNIKIRVTGRNINNYIKKIMKLKINIIKLIPISYKEIILLVSYEDYLVLKKFSYAYDIEILDFYGKMKIEKVLKNNWLVFCLLGLGVALIIFFSNVIFFIEIVHNDKTIRELLYSELNSHGIVKYKLKKGYQELEKIEEEILDDNKDKLEWIEIENIGTKYIVRAESRIIRNNNNINNINNIVSNKNAIITMIKAQSGEKVHNINDYVTKGQVIISNEVVMPNGTIINKNAIGIVYGEVWYDVSITYPLIYKESRLTGKTKKIISINFLSKKIGLINFNKYKNFNKSTNILYEDMFMPFSITKDKLYELNVIEKIYTLEEVNNEAINYVKNKMILSNDKIIEFKNITILKEEASNSSKTLQLFVSVIEDIGISSEVPNAE